MTRPLWPTRRALLADLADLAAIFPAAALLLLAANLIREALL